MTKELTKNNEEVPEHVDGEIVVKEEGALALFEEASDGPTGFEDTDARSFKTPFVKILQALSPELKQQSPEYIPNAQQGLFCNTATKELYYDISVIIVKMEHALVTWKPDRGGFVARHTLQDEHKIVAKTDGLKKYDADGNDIVDTLEFFCINADNPEDMFILSLSKTGFKHGRTLATRLRNLTSNGKKVNRTFAGVWNLQVGEEHKDAHSWYTLSSNKTEFVRFITEKEYNLLVKVAQEMLKTAETDYSQIDDTKVDNVKDVEVDGKLINIDNTVEAF